MAIHKKQKGAVIVICMIFLSIFAALAISMIEMSDVNVQVANDYRHANQALSNAHSGLECGKYLVTTAALMSTGNNTVSLEQANTTWTTLCQHIQDSDIGGGAITGPANFADSTGSGQEIIISAINLGSNTSQFAIRFFRYNDDPNTSELEPLAIKIQTNGTDHDMAKQVQMDMVISKENDILNYAVASKSRVMITGDSTIQGSIYSTWNQPGIASPFEMEAESTVNGSINTVTDYSYFDPDDDDSVGYTLETLDENGNPMYDENGDRIVSEDDKVQGTNEGINYGQDIPDMPGFDAADYDTSSYQSQTTYFTVDDTTGYDNRVTEYFPHADNSFTERANWSSKRLHRYVLENQTFTNKKLGSGSSALFKNCTFEGVLFIECDTQNENPAYTDNNGYYNNIRFENCTFNGTIVTEVPNDFKWKDNMLYFTGDAIFNNQYMEEATILAPNFNVNLGNARELQDESESVLTGMVVGGIVDIRGNANVDGTVLSMFDPTGIAGSGAYGTNIGFSNENDEASVPGDGETGIINIHPAPDRLLPSGITTPITITPVQSTYTEI